MACFSERLRELRLEKNIGQKEVGAIIGVSDSSIRKYEVGDRTPDPTAIVKLADYFGVTTDYLLGRTTYRSPIITEAAHRTDDPSLELPEDARKSLEDFKKFIYEKHGIKFN